jgi:ABC-type enterochelin transport system substrate-binding protein
MSRIWNEPRKVISAGLLVFGIAGLSALLTLTPTRLQATSESSSQANTMKINRSLPDGKNGKVTRMSQTAVVIDTVAYDLAPTLRIEMQTGNPLPLSSTWSKLLHYPVPVRYWATGNQVTQMILTLPE